jgi:hypothetical protein
MSKELALNRMEREWVMYEGRTGTGDAHNAADPTDDLPTIAQLVEEYLESSSREFDELEDGSKPRAAVVRMGAQAWAQNWHIAATQMKRDYDRGHRDNEED